MQRAVAGDPFAEVTHSGKLGVLGAGRLGEEVVDVQLPAPCRLRSRRLPPAARRRSSPRRSAPPRAAGATGQLIVRADSAYYAAAVRRLHAGHGCQGTPGPPGL